MSLLSLFYGPCSPGVLDPYGSYNPCSPSSAGFPELHLVFVGLYICSYQLLEEVSLMTIGLENDL